MNPLHGRMQRRRECGGLALTKQDAWKGRCHLDQEGVIVLRDDAAGRHRPIQTDAWPPWRPARMEALSARQCLSVWLAEAGQLVEAQAQQRMGACKGVRPL